MNRRGAEVGPSNDLSGLLNAYLKRVQDSTDSRVTQIHLTDKAKALADDFQEISRQMRQTIYRGFTKKDQKELVDRPEKAIHNFDVE